MPNTFFESIAAAQQAIAEIEPALVIMLGEYPGTQHDHRRATRAKRQRLRAPARRLRRQGFAGEPTDPAGPVAYHATTVPVRAMVLAMRRSACQLTSRTRRAMLVCNHHGRRHHCPAIVVHAGLIHLAVSLPMSPLITTSVFIQTTRRRSPITAGRGSHSQSADTNQPAAIADLGRS